MSFFDGSFGERFLSIPGRSLQILVAFGPHLLKIHDFWLWVLVLSELPVSIPELPVTLVGSSGIMEAIAPELPV